MAREGRLKRLAAAVLAAMLAGCAAPARLALVEPGGGAVAIPSNRPPSREEALALIARQCPGGFAIVREEEVVIGTDVRNESSTEFDPVFKEKRTTESVRTHRRTEWRITFTCK